MLNAATRGRPPPALRDKGSLELPSVQCGEDGVARSQLHTQSGAGTCFTTGSLGGLVPKPRSVVPVRFLGVNTPMASFDQPTIHTVDNACKSSQEHR